MASGVDGNGGSGGLVVTELLGHIKELVTQLETHLGGSSPDLCRHLASQISSVNERSISLLITTSSSSLGGARKRSAVASPLSDASDAPFVKATKKRKTVGKKRHQVRVGSAGDHPADDGHSWRKYGQKEILGAKHPRGYYRCTHRHSWGCTATKQVQRTDEDPTFFDVVYLGDHTCVQRAAAGQAAADAQAPEHNDNPAASKSLLHNLSSSLTVKTEEPAVELEPLLLGWDAPAPFCFPSTPATGAGPQPLLRAIHVRQLGRVPGDLGVQPRCLFAAFRGRRRRRAVRVRVGGSHFSDRRQSRRRRVRRRPRHRQLLRVI